MPSIEIALPMFIYALERVLKALLIESSQHQVDYWMKASMERVGAA